MSEHVYGVFLGAGVVGLAVARALALLGREVLVLEAAPTFRTGTSAAASWWWPPPMRSANPCAPYRRMPWAMAWHCNGWSATQRVPWSPPSNAWLHCTRPIPALWTAMR